MTAQHVTTLPATCSGEDRNTLMLPSSVTHGVAFFIEEATVVDKQSAVTTLFKCAYV